ncbi:MAG: NAD-dependent epimerase/dehydratase family protein [Nitrososphaerales archaeon]
MTGGAGFIGSSLCECLLTKDYHVICFDNLSAGSRSNLSRILTRRDFVLVEGDCKSEHDLATVERDIDVVFHLSANPEVRPDRVDPNTCFTENILATKNVLESVRRSSASILVFASSSTVYGDALVHPTAEDYAPLLPISIYGASKLASEALISGYARTYGLKAIIFRLANVVGPKSNHGVVPDFMEKLKGNAEELEILGDGTQTKSYLHVDDCVMAMTRECSANDSVSTFNLGAEDQINVRTVADIVCEEMGVKPHYTFTGGVDGGRGWRGDVKNMLLDISKLESVGWKPKCNSAEAVRKTVQELLQKRVGT